MRQAENTGPGPVSVPEEQGRSPIKVGAVVLAVVLAAWGLLWLTTKPEQPRGPGAERGPAFALTDAEALDRFEELTQLVGRAYDQRDLSLIDLIYTKDSPRRNDVRHQIDRLIADDIRDEGSLRTTQLNLVSNTPDEIRIREVAVLRPCFKTESGRDVTRGPTAIRQVSLWTLRQQLGNWLVHDAVLEEDRVLQRGGKHCA